MYDRQHQQKNTDGDHQQGNYERMPPLRIAQQQIDIKDTCNGKPKPHGDHQCGENHQQQCDHGKKQLKIKQRHTHDDRKPPQNDHPVSTYQRWRRPRKPDIYPQKYQDCHTQIDQRKTVWKVMLLQRSVKQQQSAIKYRPQNPQMKTAQCHQMADPQSGDLFPEWFWQRCGKEDRLIECLYLR